MVDIFLDQLGLYRETVHWKIPGNGVLSYCNYSTSLQASNKGLSERQAKVLTSRALSSIICRTLANRSTLATCQAFVCPSTGWAPTLAPSLFIQFTSSSTYSSSRSFSEWNILPVPFCCNRCWYSLLISSVVGRRAFPVRTAATAMAWNSKSEKLAVKKGMPMKMRLGSGM